MTRRDPAGVLLLWIITCGIYGLVWLVETKDEMNRKGAQIPTAWIWFIPFAVFYWYWKYGEGVELVTGGVRSAGSTFAIFVIPFVNFFAIAIVQGWFNQVPQVYAMCSACGSNNFPNSISCWKCGQAMPVGMQPQKGYMQPVQRGYAPQQHGYIGCPYCGASNYPSSISCWKCRQRIASVAQPQQRHVSQPQAIDASASEQAVAYAQERSVLCPTCGGSNPSDYRFCCNCARPLSASIQAIGAIAPASVPVTVPKVRRAVAPCPKCRETIWSEHSDSLCPRCKEPLPDEIKTLLPKLVQSLCRYCNGSLTKTAKFCPQCGSSIAVGSV